jgi:amidohydrolase
MHACGHDAHTTILMGVAEMLNDRRDQFDGTVKLMFQPAEEGPGGAVAMIHDKILEDPKVDAAIALHVSPLWRAGQIGVASGFSSAASDRVQIMVKGVGGHAARPHMSVDSTVVASQILLLLQTIVSREIDPFEQAVITFGVLQAGTASNVIPDTAVLQGTVRTYSPAVRDHIEKRTKEIAAGIGLAMRAEVKVAYLRGYPALNNDAGMAEIVRAAASEVLGPENVFKRVPGMGGEDMAFVAQKVPTCMFNLGIANPEQGKTFAPHHPRFDIDEDAMAAGVKVMVASALKYLND